MPCRRAGRLALLRGLVLPLMLPALAATAAAQGAKLQDIARELRVCGGLDGDPPEARIRSCSAIIDSLAATQRARAIALNNRGNAYNAQGDHRRAIEDYDASVARDPDYASAFNNRGVAHQKLGDH
ncbi:MAG TPA: tetratricopeptide repeat protein, partial [Xanthobacteraceae bacterium]|nr:tetratricopeptide repeat protein [Xanthobacteraceae bacterium]